MQKWDAMDGDTDGFQKGLCKQIGRSFIVKCGSHLGLDFPPLQVHARVPEGTVMPP